MEFPIKKKEGDLLISVLMPVKNATPYLEECLESILDQSEEHWELIAIDDHSTDHSLQILKAYAERESRIRVEVNNGNGIIPALQLAYQLSSGELIHRMDADDRMPSEKLSCLKNILINHGRGVVATGKIKYFSDLGISDGYAKYENWLNHLSEKDCHWQEIYKECVIASPAWMLWRSDFEHCGAFNNHIYPEDYDLVFRIYKSNFKVIASSQIVHLWRDHPQRTSRNHPHYQQNAFFEIKLHYFLQLDYQKNRELILWGAGKKGKLMAKLLQKEQLTFLWVSNNPNKYGQKIYEQLMHSYEEILTDQAVQIIITVAQRNAKAEILSFLKEKGIELEKSVWFFS